VRAEDARATIGKIAAKAAAIEFMAADLNSDAGWANAVVGADYVLHVASPLPAANPKSDDELVRVARNGVLRVLKASRDAGVKRVVMTSAMAAIAYGRGERAAPFSEADWTDGTNRNDTSAYERSKTIAERAAWAWYKAEGGALELVIAYTLDVCDEAGGEHWIVLIVNRSISVGPIGPVPTDRRCAVGARARASATRPRMAAKPVSQRRARNGLVCPLVESPE
jgi:nucleoside-diphosphate-sugar epimerase